MASEPVNRNDSVAVARIRHALVGDQVQNEKGRRHCGPNCCNNWYTLQDSNLRPSDPKSDALFN